MVQEYQVNDQEIAAFRGIVQEYTRKAVCGQEYVLVDSLTQWLESRVQPQSSTTQASRLLEAVYRSPDPGDPITPEQLGDCLIVFSILLTLGKGYLIHFFRRYQIHDRHLPIPPLTLRDKISTLGLPAEFESAFIETQWRFCPVKFDLGMDNFCPPDSIIPICRKKRINKKGGTSEVWDVDVYEEFVAPNLRSKLLNSRYELKEPSGPARWHYQFALKTFKQGWHEMFENEKKAFQGLRDHQGMVKYLGDYSHTGHREEGTLRTITTHNILLEYGEMDLQEFFVDRSPPVLNSEIGRFWKDISDVATALEGIHNLKTKKYKGNEEYHGWHADIKPDNILIVQGQFKLADPGFTTFIRANDSDPDPKAVLLGGTITYAAPECGNNTARGPMDAVPQTIDTWSLGCVFSVAASWVVLGEQGIKQYRTIRQKALRKILDGRTQSDDMSRNQGLNSIVGDYFHDGHGVLNDVIGWHNYLRQALRKTDTITGRILDLVEKGMLVGNPQERMKAKGVCDSLSIIMRDCSSTFSEEVPKSILASLYEMDKEATSTSDISGPPTIIRHDNDTLTVSDKRQAANSRLLNQSILKTAHRSDYQKSSTYPEEIQTDQPNGVYGTTKSIMPSMSTTTQNMPKETSRAPTLRHQFTQSEQRSSISTRPPTYRDVYQAREEVEQRSKEEKNKTILQALKLKKCRHEDPLLSGYFLTRKRDVKFLVDNGSTMIPWWARATYLLETLLMKLEGMDENGMDLAFTFGPVTLQNKKSRADFMKAMGDARPPKDSVHATDMRQSLQIILDQYIAEVKKRHRMKGEAKDLTILVLTDGIWEGTSDKERVDQTIVKFLQDFKDIKADLSLRPASIEFIQFGYDSNATFKLRQLDNNLFKWDGLEDIIDTEHSDGNVNKMILGSFVERFDMENDDGEDSNTEQTPSPPVQSPHSPYHGSSMDTTPQYSPMSPTDGRPLSLQTSPENMTYGPFHPSPSRTPTRNESSRTARRESGYFNSGSDAQGSRFKEKHRAP
ncbi:hypothetical protein DL95DRAFT_521669 [Leptodontidium sp. 2 PMI_412]|nr:hypothetical protein DL95DRAFT_521669 [Leptodontidium sp. 2 PMI_412]